MFCGNCGSQVDDGVRFCPNCGNDLGVTETAPQPEPVVNNTQPTQPIQPQSIPAQPVQSQGVPAQPVGYAQPAKKKGLSKGAIIGIVAACVLVPLLIIGGIIFAFVGVPMFSAVSKNEQKKACNSNMRIIRSNLASYMLGAGTYDGMTHEFEYSGDYTYDLYYNYDFAAMFDKGEVPTCTSGDRNEWYEIYATGPTTFTITCENTDCPNYLNEG